MMSVIMTLIRIEEDSVARIFTQDETDIYYIKEVIDIMSIYMMLDTIHGVNTGIVRGLGKQLLASIATIVCYYAFGLPLALCLGFKKDLAIRGFWIGFTFALSLQDFFVTLVILRADWEIGLKKTSKGDAIDCEDDEFHSAAQVDEEGYKDMTEPGR